ncbi:peptidoglycan DD-metalloendopeptidase family protein [Nakamurella sp. YIM 132087]|uniref:Peptidoglycan DD-metalloendopeptidase family protein n=1 Tax=Nakamurella alba TaxID=2665158 RepID=A0A7K1FER4_9ACTN|nr:M23 family metallopeptidase [Nakamurella alba]MTD12597.1 peptidoglycan DD-metalloendopeptidase family protein [Nakamurella alba]
MSSVPTGTSANEPEHFTPLIITSISPDPVPVTGTDRKIYLVYELQVLNAAPRPATITSVDTLGGASGEILASLTGDQVVARSLLVADYALPPVPATTIPAGRTLLLVMDAAFDAAGSVPTSIVHRITATFGDFDPNQGDFALNNFPGRITQTGGAVSVGTGAPEVVAPPLAGPDWVAVNACCELSPHRGAMLPLDGRINGAERYAVDFAKFDLTAEPIVDLEKGTQASFSGDPDKNESYFAFGQPILAVADAEVVTVVQDLPEAPPHVFLQGLGVGELGGNHVVLKLRDGVYAFYGHLKTGSVTVAVGDRVQVGEQIAELGNSGNTSEAHLHFHLMNGPLPLTATNLPWVIDSFTWDGDVTPEKLLTATAGERTDELPLIYGAMTFPAVG